MELKQALETARAVLSRIGKVRDALARAKAQTPAAVTKAEAAERALSRAHADALIEADAIKPAALEALERNSEQAARESRVASQAERDLFARLASAPGELAHAREELNGALQRALGAAFASLLREARGALTPVRTQLEKIRKAVPPMFQNADSWALEAALSNIDTGSAGAKSEPLAKGDLAAALEVQGVVTALTRLEDEVGQILRDAREAQARPTARANGLQRVSA